MAACMRARTVLWQRVGCGNQGAILSLQHSQVAAAHCTVMTQTRARHTIRLCGNPLQSLTTVLAAPALKQHQPSAATTHAEAGAGQNRRQQAAT